MEINDHIKSYIREHSESDVHQLLFAKNKELTEPELKFAIQQIEGRQRAKKKLPTLWANLDVLYPVHLSLEQCSSEETAIYKSSLVKGDSMVDLTGGFGIDTYFLAKKFKQVTHVERDTDLSQIAAHNFSVLNQTNISCLNTSTEDYLQTTDKVDLFYIDPARRDNHGSKIVSIADCTPNLMEIQELFASKSSGALIKLSPMLDIKQSTRELDCITDIYIVSVRNECKELLIKTNYTQPNTDNITIHCVNLLPDNQRENFEFKLNENDNQCITYTSEIGNYLYEPNASIQKAGGFGSLSRELNLNKVHPNSHLFTLNTYLENFPGRIIKVNEVYGFDKQALKKLKSELTKVNLIVRNFPSTPQDLLKRLKMNEGGVDYLYATTLNDNRKVLIQGTRCN